VKSAGLEDLLNYDQHPRMTFIDHFLADDTSLDGLARGRYRERGDFASGAYELVAHKDKSVQLRRRGNIDGREVTVDKTLTLEGARLACSYRVSAPGAPFDVTFAPEINLTLLAGDAQDRYYRVPGRTLSTDERKLASRGELEAGPLELVNDWDKFFVRVSSLPATMTWRYPLETASQSEGGFERTYQGSVILPVWRGQTLGDGHTFEGTVTLELEQIPHA
jgi:hypothetical protein